MKTDISRSTFRTSKNYSAVRMQQGRVVLDTDWNEQVDIENHRSRILTVDSLGPVGAPAGDAGFQITASGDSTDLLVSPGRFYVDGILVGNDAEFNVSTQNDLPGIALPTADGNYLAYLKVHERAVTALEDPEIRETALGGPDTTTRSRVIRQILLTPVAGTEFDSRTIPAEWSKIISRNPGRLSARTEADGGSDPCAVGTRGGYTGLDNLLYRVEIHDGGAAGTATYKWSRDNGALVTEWLEQEGDTLTVRSTGNDNVLNFAPGQWIEISDDGLELEGVPGTLAQILRVEGRRITINPDNIQHFPGSAGTLDINEFSRGVRKVRRWDMVDLVSPPTVPDGAGGETWITLENGIEVKFDDLASAREFRTGDYWMIPARADNNNIQWACDNNGNIEHEPDGIHFAYARLAFVNVAAGAWSVVADAREIFPGLTDEELAYVGGDGQLSVPGQVLDRPLEVRVTRGATPVADAKVRFSVTGGTGSIDDTLGGTPGTTLDIKSDANGIARVNWTLIDAAAGQSVTAVLLDETDQTTALYITFGAGSGVASGIQYTPISTDTSVAGTTNVQEALDALADNKVNRSGDTMTGNLTVNADLEVTGNMTIRGDVIARDATQQAGDVLLGDDDIDRVIIHGTLQSNHTSGALEIEAPVHARTTDPTKSPLRVDGPSTGGSPRLFRLPLDLDHTDGSATTLTDYQLPITVDTATPIAAGRMESDGADILFEDEDGTSLPFWVESGINTATTLIWVRVPTITAGANRTVYMLYGNDNAVSQSSSASTFLREIPGHVLAYNFDEGSGTTTIDYSGNSQDGTITGATYTAGQFGQALNFDGTTNVVQATTTWSAIAAGDFSISVWFRPETIAGDSRVLFSDQTFTNFMLNVNPNGELVMHIGTVATGSPIYPWTLNAWHHVVAVRSAGQVTLYVNGASIHTDANATSVAASTLIDVGYRTSDNMHPVDGQIDEVRVLNRALTIDEITDQFSNTPYLTLNNAGAELLRATPALEPVITAQPEEANPLGETPILFAQETSGNIGIGTDSPGEKLTVDGIIETKTGGIKFPDGTIQTTAGGGPGGGGDSLPLGTIMAWHRDFQGAPAVPDGWVECNGLPLNDPDSPYDGLVIPNLNGQKNPWNTKGAFLRGGAVSGDFEDDEFQAHIHSVYPHAGTPNGEFVRNVEGAAATDVVTPVANGVTSSPVGPPAPTSYGPPRAGAETKPVNMSVVWIMKVKLVDGQSGLWVPGTEGIRYDSGKVSIGTAVADEQLTVSGAISLEEKIIEPTTADDFGKIYVRENDLSHLTLNGTDQYVSMPALGNNAVGDFTVALWFRLGSVERPNGNISFLFDLRLDTTGGQGPAGFITSLGNGESRTDAVINYPSGGDNHFRMFMGNGIGEWRHYALSREGAVMRLFVDGHLISSEPQEGGTPKSDLLDWTVAWRIGSRFIPAGPNENFPGDLDDMGIWTRALSEGEMAALHNAGRGSDVTTGFASSLLAFYPMSPSLTAGQLDDTSGNDLHGTIQNGATITPERVGSLYFKDGFGNVTSLAGGGDSYRTGGSGNQVPLGTIMAWHKSFLNTPAIPDGWVECNGQTLDDPASPYHDQLIPNLNNPKESWNAKGSFLRGDLVSGDFEDDVFQGHRHAYSPANWVLSAGGGSQEAAGGVNQHSPLTILDPTNDGTNGNPRTGSETAPVNMSVVWIMKVRETDRDRGLWRENGEDIYFDDGKVGVGAKTATAKLHVSAETVSEAPLRIDAQITQQGVQGRLFRQPIALTNNDANDAADFQTLIIVDTLALIGAGKLRFDGGDLLFVDEDGTTILPHFIESGLNTDTTRVWVRLPLIAGSMNRTIFMQYGKPEATQGDSAETTFEDIIDGVVVAYEMDEGSGTTLTDVSGGGFNTNHDAGWIAGHRGAALDFNGSTQNVSSAVRNWGFGSTGSVSVWVKTTDTGVQRPIMSLQHGNVQDEFLLYMHNNNKVAVYNHKSGGNSIRRESTNAINTGDWVHIAAVMDGGVDPSQLRLYINGVRDEGTFLATGSPAPIVDSTQRALHIGFRASVNDYFLGQIDKFRLYSTALTDAQVAALYNGETFFSANDPGREFVLKSLAADPTASATREITDLAGAWNLDEGSGTTITDRSGNGNTGNLAGPTWTADRFGTANRALLFDGVDDHVQVPHNASLNVASDITLSAWIYSEGPGTGSQSTDVGNIIAKHLTGNNRSYLMSFRHDVQTIRLTLNEPDDTIHVLDSNNVSYNQWYHVAATYDRTAGTMNIYIDGVLDRTQTIGQIDLQQITEPVYIGCYADGPSGTGRRSFFRGTIDDPRIYDRALSPEEIADLHQFGGVLTVLNGVEMIFTDPNAIIASSVSGEEPNPVSGSPILFAQNLTGNIGIGTDDPLAKLHVAGTAGVDGIMFPDGTVQTTAGGGGGGDSTPLGTIIAWHKSLTGTPAIPDGWVECNGQLLSDAASPYDGQVIPNLNGDPAGANSPDLSDKKSMFLRGSLTSGTGQDDAFQGHYHNRNPEGLTEFEMTNRQNGSNAIVGGVGHPLNEVTTGAAVSDGTNGAPRTADETRPVNMTVVWIMKVKQSAGSSIWQINASDTYFDAGNVAIGTNAANAKLTVDGDLSIKEGGTVPDADIGFGKIYAQENTLRHLEFDGVGDSVSMPALGVTGIVDFTVSAWFKIDAHNPATFTYLADFRNSTITQGPFLVFSDLGADGADFFPGVAQPTDGTVQHRYKVGEILSQWHHAVFVREGTTTRSYIDGILVEDIHNIGSSTGEAIDLNHAWALGAPTSTAAVGGNFYLNGSLSQIAIWNRPLAGHEIASVFAGGREIDLMQNFSTRMLGYWPVDSNDIGTTLNDHSGNNNHGTLQANTSFASETAGSLYYKDGQGTTTTLAGASSFPWSAGSTGRDVPIGTIMAWHKDFTGTPAIPDGWVECNGQVLDDALSPYNTQTIPDLNNDAGAGEGGRFLRGDTASGTVQPDQFGSHSHDVVAMRDTAGGTESGAISRGFGNPAPNGSTSSMGGAETRPVNMSVVWIMKVRHTGNGVWVDVPQGVSFDAGDVAIGTTAPVSKLTVDGALSLREDIPTPGATLGFGKLYTRSTDLSYLELAGTNQYVTMPGLGEASVGDFTISIWMRLRTPDAGAPNVYILDMRGDGTATDDGPHLVTEHLGNREMRLIHFIAYPDLNLTGFQDNIGNISGQWHHTVFSRTGSQLRQYLDGRLISDSPTFGVAPRSDSVDMSKGWRIGTSFDANAGDSRFWNGALDDAAVWNRALSDDEIAAIHNAGRGTDLTTRYSGSLLGFWPMDDGASSSTIRDASGNGFDGTLQNGASIVEDQAGSLLFQDGFGNTTTLAGSGGSFGSSGGGREVPLGTIMAWHKDLTGTPSMPPGWVECNGQVLSDIESPYDGQTIPNLNGDPAGADSPDVADKKSMFLRGSLTSGAGQDDALQGHWHEHWYRAPAGLSGGGIVEVDGGLLPNNTQGANDVVRDAVTDGSNGTPRVADETRPVNMSVVWIMKIKHIGDAAWEPATNGLAYMGGRVGIGTTSPAYELDVNGTIRGANVSPSDMRWKTDVTEVDGALGLLHKLRGVRFNWDEKATTDMALADGPQLGLIAQEVEAVLPEVVSTAPDGYKSIEYGKLVAVLIEAIKELTEKN